jgi:probable O-glycosylation ligase (exosortase A-associated)
MYSIRDIIVLGAVGVSLPVCFARPFFGVIMWTIFAFVNPHQFAWGVASQSSLALAIAVATIAGGVIFGMKWRALICREVVLLGVLWVWFTLTTLNSAHTPLFAPNAENTWLHWTTVSKILLMTVLTVAVVNTWNRLRWLALSIAGAFGFLVLKSVPFMVLSGGAFRLYGPPHSMVADNNDLGLALNMTIPFFLFLARTETNTRLKWILGFTFMASIPAIFFTYSRGAFLGLVAVFLCMLVQAKQKAVLIPVLVAVVTFGAVVAPQAWRNRISSSDPNALDASARSRINAWTYSWRLVNDYPLMGGGFDTFTPELFARYAPNPADVRGPHSIYFGVLAEHGFFGLFLYLALIVSCLLSLRGMAKRARWEADLVTASYALMLEFSLVGFLVSGAFLGRAYFDYFFTIVACVAVLRQLPKEPPEEAVEAEEQPSEMQEA